MDDSTGCLKDGVQALIGRLHAIQIKGNWPEVSQLETKLVQFHIYLYSFLLFTLAVGWNVALCL